MGWQLVQKLLDAISLSWTVDVGNLVLRNTAEVLINLLWLDPGRHPGILFRGAARVVVRYGVPLEVRHQLHHHSLQLAGHRANHMLLTHTLTVHTDLPPSVHAEARTLFSTAHTWLTSVRILSLSRAIGAPFLRAPREHVGGFTTKLA